MPAAGAGCAASGVLATPLALSGQRVTSRARTGREPLPQPFIGVPPSETMDERSRYKQFEDQFHRQLVKRAEQLLGRWLPADRVRVETTPDGAETVRAAVSRWGASAANPYALEQSLPGAQGQQLRFERRVLGPLRREVVRLRAQVLMPLQAMILGGAAGPIDAEYVRDALARFRSMPRPQRPTAVVFASPTGFTPEARALVNAAGDCSLILMGGRADGGWDVDVPEVLKKSPWRPLFELESLDERVGRLVYHLQKHAVELESRGLALPELAEQLGLPGEQVVALVREACRRDGRLMTVVHEGVLHVCRSPLADEVREMNWWSWIRRNVFRLPPSPAERVRELTAQRVQLEAERHQLDQRLTGLGEQARELEQRGVDAKNDAERRAIAGQLMRTEREMRRVQAQANMLTQQIDVIGTHIHHQTMAEKGKRVALPSSEELAREAAQAEAMMAELATSADLAASIEVGATSPAMAEEEQAIMERFRAAAAEKAAPSKAGAEPAPPAAERSRAPGAERLAGGPAPAEPPPGEKSKAKPELS